MEDNEKSHKRILFGITLILIAVTIALYRLQKMEEKIDTLILKK